MRGSDAYSRVTIRSARRVRRREIICSLVLFIELTTPGLAQQNNPLAGTWQANIAKSQRHPNHLFKSATLRFEVSEDAVLLTYSGVNMSGVEEKGTFTIHPDGKEHPIPGQPGLVEVSKWVGPRLLETVARQDGKVVGRSSYEISEDGKTLTAKISGADGSGAQFEQVIVCDRQ